MERNKGNNKYFSFQRTHPKKLVFLPWAGLEPTSPWSLVGRANHYTIKDHHAGNVAEIDVIVFFLLAALSTAANT